jgi:hypothetical protein
MDLHGIGDSSRTSGLPVKTLRFDHDKGLLIPASVEPENGWRRYDRRNLDPALVIVALRRLDFGQLGCKVGRHVGEYREDDADHELCSPLEKAVTAKGVEMRRIPGGRACEDPPRSCGERGPWG